MRFNKLPCAFAEKRVTRFVAEFGVRLGFDNHTRGLPPNQFATNHRPRTANGIGCKQFMIHG
jgi:hypothetical protein